MLLLVALVGSIGCASTPAAEPDTTSRRADEARPFTLADGQPAPVQRSSSDGMDNLALDALLRKEVDTVKGEAPVWQFEFRGVNMAVFTDQSSDRMRIIAPILPVEEIDAEIMKLLMEANFHTALDARYATSDGVVYSTFIHPLSSLTQDDFRSALKQVSSLVLTFGTTFSSGSVGFAK